MSPGSPCERNAGASRDRSCCSVIVAWLHNPTGDDENNTRVRAGVAQTIFAHDCGGVDSLGKNLVVIGLMLAAVGALLWLWGRSGGGALPGDIVIERKNFRLYFPVVTCLVASAVLSLLVWLFRR